MVDGVSMQYQWWSRDSYWRTLYHLRSLKDVFAEEKSPQGPWVYLPSPSSGPSIWQAPFTQALPCLQDNKQHHVWLVSEFSGLERSICIGCCCVVTPVCLTTVARALRKQKPTVVWRKSQIQCKQAWPWLRVRHPHSQNWSPSMHRVRAQTILN